MKAILSIVAGGLSFLASLPALAETIDLGEMQVESVVHALGIQQTSRIVLSNGSARIDFACRRLILDLPDVLGCEQRHIEASKFDFYCNAGRGYERGLEVGDVVSAKIEYSLTGSSFKTTDVIVQVPGEPRTRSFANGGAVRVDPVDLPADCDAH